MASPFLQFYTVAGTAISSLGLGTFLAGQESGETEVILWNNKGGVTVVDTAQDTVVGLRNNSAPVSDDPVTSGWFQARSNGIENPGGASNIFDDAQVAFTTLTDLRMLQIGDLPHNVGRHIFFRAQIPDNTLPRSDVTVRLIAGTGPRSFPLPFFFNRAFGDGFIENKVAQIFPAILQFKAGFWDNISLAIGGRYLGTTNKQFLVRIAAGGTLGLDATYHTSTDGGLTFSSPALTTSATAFVPIATSAGATEGILVKWGTAVGVSLGDIWGIHAAVDPWFLIPGGTRSLSGYVGWGEAFVHNNRILHQSPTLISNFTANTRNFLVMKADGEFEKSLSGDPQSGKLVLGWFKTDSNTVIETGKVAHRITLGLDLFDDFAPVPQSLVGLTWTYFRGRFRRFNEVVNIPPLGTDSPLGVLSLAPGVTNFVQVDPINEAVEVNAVGYDVDHLPLYQVGTDNAHVTGFQDDRTRIGVTTLKKTFVATVSNVSTGASTSFHLTGFSNRSLIRRTVLTPSDISAGYTVSFYEDDAFTSLEYEAGSLVDVFTDSFTWFHEDKDSTNELHGIVENQTGTTISLTVDLLHEQKA